MTRTSNSRGFNTLQGDEIRLRGEDCGEAQEEDVGEGAVDVVETVELSKGGVYHKQGYQLVRQRKRFVES